MTRELKRSMEKWRKKNSLNITNTLLHFNLKTEERDRDMFDVSYIPSQHGYINSKSSEEYSITQLAVNLHNVNFVKNRLILHSIVKN